MTLKERKRIVNDVAPVIATFYEAMLDLSGGDDDYITAALMSLIRAHSRKIKMDPSVYCHGLGILLQKEGEPDANP